MVFCLAELMLQYSDYADGKGKIRRLVKDNKLIPVKKGLYVDDMDLNPAYLASWIYGPSYLSFDYVLYFYDLIPENVYVYTSATFGKRKRKTYENRFGTYTYQDVPKAVYPYCVKVEIDGEYSYQVATCEKALCDKLYIISPVKNMKEFKYVLFEDLRIDEDGFWSLNMEDLLFLAPLYHTSNLDFLAQFINRSR